MHRDNNGVFSKIRSKRAEAFEDEKMATVWLTLKKSLHCRTQPSDVHEPKARRKASKDNSLGSLLSARKSDARSGCSRSISNLRDVVIHGSKRHGESRKPTSCSPRSIGSSEFLNPITHEVILSNSRCELRITGFGETYVGTLKPGTPYRGAVSVSGSVTPPSRSPGLSGFGGGSPFSSASFGNGGAAHHFLPTTPRSSVEARMQRSRTSGGVTCHKCASQFLMSEGLEEHHLSKHAVTELLEGDNSRKIVEMICKTSWQKAENNCGWIERVLKVHNMQKTLSRFEEYRESVKLKASKLSKKHPRCLADGNELLRFYGTTIACSLGAGGASGLCKSEKCSVCRIIRNGFSVTNGLKDGTGVFTTSTSESAFESTEVYYGNSNIRKALIVCRVIAGRVHKPLENLQEISNQSGFDSVAGKVGPYANIEELYLLNPRALLPCFVVICKP